MSWPKRLIADLLDGCGRDNVVIFEIFLTELSYAGTLSARGKGPCGCRMSLGDAFIPRCQKATAFGAVAFITRLYLRSGHMWGVPYDRHIARTGCYGLSLGCISSGCCSLVEFAEASDNCNNRRYEIDDYACHRGCKSIHLCLSGIKRNEPHVRKQ